MFWRCLLSAADFRKQAACPVDIGVGGGGGGCGAIHDYATQSLSLSLSVSGLPGLGFSRPKKNKFGFFVNLLPSNFLRVY